MINPVASPNDQPRGDHLVVLHSATGKVASKTFRLVRDKKSGETKIKNRDFSNETFFRIECVPVDTFTALGEALTRLISQKTAFVIRGKALPDTNPNHTPRWKRPRGNQPATFAAADRRWVAVDIDHIPAPVLTDPLTDPEGAIEYLIGRLPSELHDASCWWQFTSSQGLPKTEAGAPDTLSARLFFWAETAYSDPDLKRWAAAANATAGLKIVDPVLYDPIQAHYIAAPSFIDMADPLPRRYGVRSGLDDEISLVIPPANVKDPDQIGEQGYETGRGVQAYLDQIGGERGFREPIKSAIASYVAIHGAKADAEPLKTAIRKAIADADPGGRSSEQLERYGSDEHLDSIIAAIRAFQGDKPGVGFTPEPPPEFDESTPPPADGGDDGPSPPEIRPIIQVSGGQLPQIIDAAEKILVETDPGVFAFGDQIVRPAIRPIRIADDRTTTGLRLVTIEPAHMSERFTRHIDFQKFNEKKKKWTSIDCPRNVAVTYLERKGLWRLPQLAALTTCPLMLPGGRILAKPGFDRGSGILFDPQGVDFPPVPEYPTPKGAREALALLMEPFRDFPFADEASKSVLRSLLLSSVSRLAFPFVPCHAFDAPSPGTGKSKLFDCASILQTGRECEVISQADDEVEFEKKLFAILLAGSTFVSIDNCDQPLDSPFLCMALTQPFVQSRILGLSKTGSVPNVAIVGANGNGFSFAGDMLRRGLTGHLDAGVEKPWEREFESEDPVIVFKSERPRLVAAALTVLRGYIAAGQPRQAAPPLGGFEGWARLVRDTLLWLGEANPTTTIETARAADPKRQELEAVITQWWNVLANRSLTSHAVIEEAAGFALNPTTSTPNHITYFHPEFRNALLVVANEGGRISANRLGKWIRANLKKVVGNYRLASDTPRDGNARWRLEEQQEDGTWQ